jgi:hypothetical protein
MAAITKKPDINTLLSWVYEAQTAASEWRAESWKDCEFYDGDQWDSVSIAAAEEAGIDPLTINRVFPTINLLKGTQSINRQNITAKARTSKDSEISQIMSEAIQFVMDQNDGKYIISQAFGDQLIPGIGLLTVGLNPDPRKEPIAVKYRDWKTFWVDPFGDPWLSPEHTRYAFVAKWMDLDTLAAIYPDKRKEIEDQFNELAGDRPDNSSFLLDEATDIEMSRRALTGSAWVQVDRKRVRPVVMWYPQYAQCVFAIFPDGTVTEISDDIPATEQYQIICQAQKCVKATVPKMWTATFMGSLLLSQETTPYDHDQYPMVPFIGYLDRYNLPYGVPRQLREQNVEVNKRRSMALAMLYKRRVTAEADVVDTPGEMDALYKEANRLDGFMKVRSGGMQKFRVEDQSNLVSPHIHLMEQAEREIQQIGGANDETMGWKSNAVSGKAIEARQAQGSMTIAPLFDNLRRSMKRLGELVVANIQKEWSGEKVLRVTDQLSGADKFVVLNEQQQDKDGAITIRNNITCGRYDLVVADAPQTDTIREKNLEMIIEWVKRAPPEVVPQLFMLAIEMSEIPNKDSVIEKLRPVLGISPEEEGMSAEEIKERTLAELEAQQQAKAEEDEIAKKTIGLELEGKGLENQKIQAEILKLTAETTAAQAKADKEDFETGYNMTRQHLSNIATGGGGA